MALVGAQFVNAVSPNPVGSLQAYAGASAPSGWLLCDGTSYSTSVYPELYSVLGYTYGGSGANFNVPDLRGRMPIGAGNDGTAANNATRTRGDKGGDTRLQQHKHSLFYGSGAVAQISAGWTSTGSGSANDGFIDNAGAGSGQNMPPFLVTNYIIKAVSDAPRSGLAYGSTPPIVTALPANPQFGDVVTYIADATNGVAWNLQYDATGTYPWKFIGGAQIHATGTGGFSSSSTPQTSNTPSLTLPLSGDYMTIFGGAVFVQANTISDSNLSLFVNGVSQSSCRITAGTTFVGSNIAKNVRITGVTAGHVANVRYFSSQSVNTSYGELFVSCTPIRVSA